MDKLNNVILDEYKELDNTRVYAQHSIINNFENLFANANVYVESDDISSLRGFVKKLYYHFLKTQIALNQFCKSFVASKNIKDKKYNAFKKKVAQEYFKGFDICVNSKHATIMNDIGLPKRIKRATELLGYSIRPVKSGNSMGFGLVVDELSGKDSVGLSVK